MSTAVVPATGGAVVPATGGAVTPAQPPNLPVSLGGGASPVANNSASREIAKPAGGAVALNLSAISVLDLIGQQMALLNEELAMLGDHLVPLDATAEAIDACVTNVDEVSKIFQAPAATRSATDAASAVGSHMSDMAVLVRQHTLNAQALNAAAFLALRAVREVQERQRAMGAGPRLLRTAGR